MGELSEIDALSATLAETFATRPSATIVPRPSTGSRDRAHAFLEQLRERGQSVELRTGRPIGEGGMGVVHEAEQIALGRTVAVKTLKPGRTDPMAAADLLREAWVTGALEHPSVVPIHHLEMVGPAPMIIMKRVDGVEWSALVRDPDEVLRRFGTSDLLGWNLGILNQVLNALRFAHSRGIIHRDLKPANVMIGNFGEVYLLDWGIAVSLRDDATGRFPLASEATELAGTPAYMAPEMLGSDVGIPLSEATDVYIAGAVLYELVVGHPPHRGPNTPAVVASIVASDPELPASVPSELAQICRRTMRPSPAERYASITELQDALRGYLEHRGSAQLASRVRDSLDELLELCNAPPTPEQTEAIYRTLAICRFGFHEALAAWRGNTDARDGVTRATVAVAGYELRAGDPKAAVALLTELDERHPLLATAQAAAAASIKRQQAFEKLSADQDLTVGLGFRWALVLTIGAIFSIVPFVGAAIPAVRSHSHANQLLVGLLSIVALLAFGGWWRSRVRATVVNRTIYQTAVFLFIAQCVLIGGTWKLGFTVRETQIVMLFYWGTIAATLAISFDRVLVICAFVHFSGFLVAARWPGTVQYAMGTANAVFTTVVALRWRRDHQRSPLAGV